MTLPIEVSSAGESPSANAPHHMLVAGVLVDPNTLELLSDIQLEEAPKSGIMLPLLAADASTFIASVAPTLETPVAIERALQLYLQQRLAGHGFRHSEVVVRALVR